MVKDQAVAIIRPVSYRGADTLSPLCVPPKSVCSCRAQPVWVGAAAAARGAQGAGARRRQRSHITRGAEGDHK